LPHHQIDLQPKKRIHFCHFAATLMFNFVFENSHMTSLLASTSTATFDI
jgi:hypothetical protein